MDTSTRPFEDRTHRVPSRLDESSEVLPRLLEPGTGGALPESQVPGHAVERGGRKGVAGRLRRPASRLLSSDEHTLKDVQDFAEEIALTASLIHPHIVGFVGVAWTNVNNLAMVMAWGT
ncbi:unnamed protein product [Phytophthora lilii]|uniref:Unnamed protein product n=1 Tax=Phytophthora lilii TaxID=2077276 RepID=A0A9W6TLW2_9STRA|nr:unnamed protein product [Phytophthora lilii]